MLFTLLVASGYFSLHKRIQEEGYLGMKGYFWAERTQQADGGEMSLFIVLLILFQNTEATVF